MGWWSGDDEADGHIIDMIGRRDVERGAQPSREERVARREQEVRASRLVAAGALEGFTPTEGTMDWAVWAADAHVDGHAASPRGP